MATSRSRQFNDESPCQTNCPSCSARRAVRCAPCHSIGSDRPALTAIAAKPRLRAQQLAQTIAGACRTMEYSLKRGTVTYSSRSHSPALRAAGSGHSRRPGLRSSLRTNELLPCLAVPAGVRPQGFHNLLVARLGQQGPPIQSVREPPPLHHVDHCVAFQACTWSGQACSHWDKGMMACGTRGCPTFRGWRTDSREQGRRRFETAPDEWEALWQADAAQPPGSSGSPVRGPPAGRGAGAGGQGG